MRFKNDTPYDILPPDTEADLCNNVLVRKIATLINKAIRATRPEDRKAISIGLDTYPDEATIKELKRMVIAAGWSSIKFECEDRPCGSSWAVIKK